MSTTTPPVDATTTPSYEQAEGFDPEALVEALANLDSVCREVEDEDIGDEVRDAGMALANLLADGGQFNGQGELAWLDGEGKQVFSWSLEEVMHKAADWALLRLTERFPSEFHAEVERIGKTTEVVKS